jgi:dUTP pyrophosphatase
MNNTLPVNVYSRDLQLINVYKFFDDAILPTRSKSTDCGLDLYSLEDKFIHVGTTAKIKTGIALNVPEGYIAKIEDRSGMAAKGLRTGGGVVDPGYNGDITVVMHNLNNIDTMPNTQRLDFGYQINKGDKIAQIILYKVDTPAVKEVYELWNSERGNNGFNSTGR